MQAIQTGGGFVRLIAPIAGIFAMWTLAAIATVAMLADLTGLPLAFQSSIIMQSNKNIGNFEEMKYKNK